MKKQLLVTGDRGETRVAILESEGGRKSDARVAELYIERRGSRSIVGNIYKGKVDNVLGGPGGRLRGHRPREERLPARRRRRHPRRRGGSPRPRRPRQGQADHRAAQARPGDPGAGGQGPAEDQGPAPVHAAVDRRPAAGLRARRRGRGRVPPAPGQGARPAAQGRGQDRPPGRRGDHPHRGPGRQEGGLRARDQVPAQAARGAVQARRRDRGAGHGLPGGRPVGARGPRHLLRAVRAGDRGRPQAAPPPRVLLHPHRSRAAPPARALQGRGAAVRALRRRGGDPVDALPPRRPAQRRLPDHRLHRGDDGDRRQLRLVHRPGQGRAPGGHDRQDQPRGRRRGRAPAEAARHRRDHRHRLHRHVALAQPRLGAEGRCARRWTRTAPRPTWWRSRRSAWWR